MGGKRVGKVRLGEFIFLGLLGFLGRVISFADTY